MDISHFSPPDSISVMGTNSDNVEFVIEDDFQRVQSLLINSAQLQQFVSKKKDLGEKIFSPVPQKVLANYFIALFKHVHESDKLRSYVVRTDTKLHHLVAQVCF